MSQMEPDPFVDADLLETRRRQRQHLASIPDWVLEPRVPKDLAAAEAPRWAGRVERTLREVADQELETLDEFLGRSTVVTSAEEAEAYVAQRVRPVPLMPGADEILDELRERRQQTRGELLSDDEGAAVARFIALVTWADELAGDYTDPRLVDRDEPRA
jgi:hypothetical protein